MEENHQQSDQLKELEALKTSIKKSKMPGPGVYHPSYLEMPPKPAPRKVKAIKGLEPIQQHTWDEMDGKARWDSIVALRGPDLKNSDLLKYFTSSVIRYRLSGIMRVGGVVDNLTPFVLVPGYGSVKDTAFSASHFIGHIAEAARWLSIPTVQVSNSLWDKLLEGHMGKYTILAYLWKESDDPTVREIAANVIASQYNLSPEKILQASKEGSNADGPSEG